MFCLVLKVLYKCSRPHVPNQALVLGLRSSQTDGVAEKKAGSGLSPIWVESLAPPLVGHAA